MSSPDKLEILRERNKDLLAKIRQQREQLERRKRGREEAEEEEEEEEEGEEEEEEDPCIHARCPDPDERPSFQQDAETPESILAHTEEMAGPSGATTTSSHAFIAAAKQKSGVGKHVRFHLNCEKTPDRKQLGEQSLLGYDWIAGVLDVEDSLKVHSDEYFDDLRTFRLRHKDECVNSTPAEFSEEQDLLPPRSRDTKSPDADDDTHQCTFSYSINNRLFPVPLASPDCCPMCGRLSSSHPHTLAEPALVRVNVPLCTLHPTHQHKPHRRRSFDPSDSLGLPAHCLSGWSHSVRSLYTPPSNLDLQSNVIKTSCTIPAQGQSVGNEFGNKSVPKLPDQN